MSLYLVVSLYVKQILTRTTLVVSHRIDLVNTKYVQLFKDIIYRLDIQDISLKLGLLLVMTEVYYWCTSPKSGENSFF